MQKFLTESKIQQIQHNELSLVYKRFIYIALI